MFPTSAGRTVVWFGIVVPILALGYVAYRASLTVRAVKAQRAGDRDRADALRAKSGYVFLGFRSALVLLALVLIVALIATR